MPPPARSSTRSPSTTPGTSPTALNGGGDNIPLDRRRRRRRSGSPSTTRPTARPSTRSRWPAGYTPADDALVADPVRAGRRGQAVLLRDDRPVRQRRPANDTGGLTGDRLTTGFDPTDKGFYEGGDLAGLHDQARLHRGPRHDRDLADPVVQEPAGAGRRARRLAPATTATGSPTSPRSTRTSARTPSSRRSSPTRTREGIKVYFDIITNHTADVISYAQQDRTRYIDQATSRTRTRTATSSTSRDYAAAPTVPDAGRRDVLPVHAGRRRQAEEHVKVPAWLNDPTLYHNRGDSTFAGESTTYGDFAGLDDLMTEHPTVVNGFVDVYDALGRPRRRRLPHRHREARELRVLAEVRRRPSRPAAASIGNPDFFMFGEVYDADPAKLSPLHAQRPT